MKVLVTGSAGFIGRNLVERLKSGDVPRVTEVLEFTLAADLLAGNGTATPADGFSINLWTLSGISPDANGDAINFNNAIFSSRIIFRKLEIGLVVFSFNSINCLLPIWMQF